MVATDLERFVEADGRADAVKEVRQKIDAEGVTYVYYQFVSVTGRIMGKGVPAPALGDDRAEGIPARLRVDGEPLHRPPRQLHRLRARGRGSWSASPSRRRSRCCRGTRESHACGAPASATARSARTAARSSPPTAAGTCSRIQEEFEEDTGLHLRAGTEPEMMWLKLDEDGKPSVEGMTKPYCYHIDQFSELQPIIHKVVEYGQKLGLDMIQGDHEDAPGQIELNFGFDRAEKTADNLSTFRQICKAGRPRARRVPVLHAEAVHGRLGERLPPQHLALGRRQERVPAGHRRRAEAEPDSGCTPSAASSSTSPR